MNRAGLICPLKKLKNKMANNENNKNALEEQKLAELGKQIEEISLKKQMDKILFASI